jgi:hypothetical protein
LGGRVGTRRVTAQSWEVGTVSFLILERDYMDSNAPICIYVAFTVVYIFYSRVKPIFFKKWKVKKLHVLQHEVYWFSWITAEERLLGLRVTHL